MSSYQVAVCYAAAASASGASIKMEKARVPFWSGPIILNVPELGISNQTLATVSS